MIKVFLVEDEIVMREGIKNTIAWEKEGFLFAGEASDGELAYPLIQQSRPDILITDIKMPFMDGLELSRLVKKEMPDIKIIILSGYDEFKYAQEGINIGIADYLLKPVTGAKLLEAVKKVADQIRKEREAQSYLELFGKEQQENLQLERQKFFRKLLAGQTSVSQLLREGSGLGFDLAAREYNLLLFKVFAVGEQEGYSEVVNTVTDRIREMAEQLPEVVMAEMSTEGMAFLVKGSRERETSEVMELLKQRLAEIVRLYPKTEYFGGEGVPVSRLSELHRCSEEANRAFAYRYILPRNQIINCDEIGSAPVVEDLKLSAMDVSQLDRRVVENFLKTGLKTEIHHFVEEYLGSFGPGSMGSLLFRQYVSMDLYITAIGFLEQLGYSSSDLAEYCGEFKSTAVIFEDLERMKQYVEEIFEAALGLREKAASKRYSSLLQKAAAYIQENYSNPEVSLNSVAASVNLSPNHFSTVFGQEMGQTFVEYLTAQRMARAKELLRGSNMKTSEIAYAVGYRDPHYFSYLFKKTQDCTPREFRSAQQGRKSD